MIPNHQKRRHEHLPSATRGNHLLLNNLANERTTTLRRQNRHLMEHRIVSWVNRVPTINIPSYEEMSASTSQQFSLMSTSMTPQDSLRVNIVRIIVAPAYMVSRNQYVIKILQRLILNVMQMKSVRLKSMNFNKCMDEPNEPGKHQSTICIQNRAVDALKTTRLGDAIVTWDLFFALVRMSGRNTEKTDTFQGIVMDATTEAIATNK